jgi:uncharacterized protein YPO0396
MNLKGAYEKKLQAKLDEWNAELDRLKAKAEGAEAEARLQYDKQISDIEAMQEAISEKLAELKSASEDAREDIKAGIELAKDSLESAMKSAAARFG